MNIKNYKLINRKWGIILSALIVVLLSSLCNAAVFDPVYLYSGRALGMGGAYIGVCDDISSININPAGLSQIEKVEFLGVYSPLYGQDICSEYFGIAVPFGYNTIAFNIARTGIKNIYSENLYSIGYSRIILKNSFFGFTAKIMNISAPGYSRYGDPSYSGGKSCFSYDMGFLRQPLDYFSYGISIENINSPTIKLIRSFAGEKINPKIKMGFAFKPKNLVFAFDINDFKEIGEALNFGAELKFSKLLAFRLGVNSNSFTSGLGVEYKNFQTDFSFLFHKNLGVLSKTGITYKL